MSSSKIIKGSKLTTKTKKTNNKKNVTNLGYIGGLAGLAGLAGLGIHRMMKKRSSKYTEPDLTMERVFQGSESEKEISQLKKYLAKEQEANKKLVDHINKCNKEVVRLQGLLSRKSSLCKEVLLRNTIKKLTK